MCRDSLINSVEQYVKDKIGAFHEKRLSSINELSLRKLLTRKNPYLFKAKHSEVAGEIIKALVDAHLSSQEEGIFGTFLEGLSVYVCEITCDGRKSSSEGIDLEFRKNGAYYIVSVKSGPNWGNSGQIAKMKDNFTKAKTRLRQGDKTLSVVAINGCCYGKQAKEDKGEYHKLCGQAFWHLITGEPDFYKQIIEPIGNDARQRNEDFKKSYAAALNKITNEFIKDFCDGNGNINWNSILEFNSARLAPNAVRAKRKRKKHY